jgi:ribosomal protein L37AE/L43A
MLKTKTYYWWLNGQLDKVEEAYKHLGMGHEFCFNCKRYTIHNNINGIIICKSCKSSKKAAFDKHLEKYLDK